MDCHGRSLVLELGDCDKHGGLPNLFTFTALALFAAGKK
jgi:hypothetical protein